MSGYVANPQRLDSTGHGGDVFQVRQGRIVMGVLDNVCDPTRSGALLRGEYMTVLFLMDTMTDRINQHKAD
ncbi:hypothetical protein GBF38_002478 [Nibea albiflora]|uniref:Uncharacterized protein n=1 Tax=Nibea albiflora TaxID=240163 RepID=A0ACB7EHE7_NIBAL|nr:hypothetical protein GBF38_002478 [Nibea albiflora]